MEKRASEETVKTGRIKSKFAGVYYRYSGKRRHNGKPDIVYDITYIHRDKKVFEKIGWASEGYTAQLASIVRAERIRAVRHGEELPSERPPAPLFEDVMDKYLVWAETAKKNGSTTDTYNRKHLSTIENKRLDEITPLDLEDIKKKKLADGLAPATVRHILVLAQEVYNKAAAWDLYKGENPLKKVKKPDVQNRRERFLSFDEAKKLLEGAQKYSMQVHDICLLSLHSGLRAGEIFALRGQDLDFKNELIHIADPKNKHPRKAYMTVQVKEMLQKRPTKAGAYIFKSKKGEQLKEVSRSFDRVVTALGFNKGIKDSRQKVVFHSLRHTFASWLALQGETIQTIAELLGHRTLAMTQRYSHLTADHKKKAVMGLQAAFKGKGNAQK